VTVLDIGDGGALVRALQRPFPWGQADKVALLPRRLNVY